MAVTIGDYFNLGDPTGGKTLKKISGVTEYETLFPWLSVILKNIYVLTAVVLFLMIFVAGLGMITNAGNVEKQKESSKTLSSAVIGFIVLFLSYWLIKIIEYLTGIQIFTLI